MQTDPPPPPELRFLKLLVGSLAGVMMVGIVVLVALVALRLPGEAPPIAPPDAVVLPDGARAQAVSYGRDWLLVVTEAGEILVFDRPDGTLRQRVPLLPE